MFDTNNYFNNNGRFKISKELLMYGIKQSYFFDVNNLNNYNNIEMDNLELKHLFNDSIFVHHPYEAPSPITLAKFLELQIETEDMEEIKSWKIPLTVKNILKRKKLNSQNDYNYNQNQQRILNASTQSLKPLNVNISSTPSRSIPSQSTMHESRTSKSRDIQAKVINSDQTQGHNSPISYSEIAILLVLFPIETLSNLIDFA